MLRRAFEPFDTSFHAKTGKLVIGIHEEKRTVSGLRQRRTAKAGAQIGNDRVAVIEDRNAGDDRRAERQLVKRHRADDGRNRVLPHTITDAAEIEQKQIWHRVSLDHLDYVFIPAPFS